MITKDYLEETLELVGEKILIKLVTNDDNGVLKIAKEGEKKKTAGNVMLVSDLVKDYGYDDLVVYPEFAGVNVEIKNENFKVLETKEVFFTFNNGQINAKNGYLVIKPKEVVKKSKLEVAKEVSSERTTGILVSKSLEGNQKMKIGDELAYSKFSGFESTIKGEKYIIMHEDEIFFIIKQNNE